MNDVKSKFEKVSENMNKDECVNHNISDAVLECLF